jgi:hypothetical protein
MHTLFIYAKQGIRPAETKTTHPEFFIILHLKLAS